MSRTRTQVTSSGSVRTGWGGGSCRLSNDNGATPAPCTYDSTEIVNYETSTPYTKTTTMTDVVTPNFRRVSAKGGIVMSPMSKTTTEITCLPVSLNGYYIESRVQNSTTNPKLGWNWSRWHGDRPGASFLNMSSFPSTPSISKDVRSLAVSNAFSNISLSEAQLWATLGEGKETIEMLYSIMKNVYNLIFRKKKFLRKQTRRLSFKEITDHWMNVRYGLRPLYYEAIGLMRALHAEPPENQRQTFRGYSQDSAETKSFGSLDWKGFRFKTERSTRITVRARAGVLTDIDFMGAVHAFGLSEIPQSMWELVPMSFIVDWFANIGTVIASWSPKPGFKFLGSWVTVETEIKQTARVVEVSPYPAWSPTNDIAGTYKNPSAPATPAYQKITTSVKREINPSRPVFPSFDVNLDTFKLLDLAIILKQLI